MTEDLYMVVLVALLPIMATALVVQTNPYQALVIRGILGAVASLIYALLGAADVALTEALVGTMLSVTLYAVAVRSSMRLRLGLLEREESSLADPYQPLLAGLRKLLLAHHIRLEPIAYPTPQALQTALMAKDIHAICVAHHTTPHSSPPSQDLHDLQLQETQMLLSPGQAPFLFQTRVHRLYELIQANLTESLALGVEVTYIDPAAWVQPDPAELGDGIPESPESVEVRA